MATPESTTILQKPKKRFRLYEGGGFPIYIDEHSSFWINGHVMGPDWTAGDYKRQGHAVPSTENEARKHLPSPDDYEFLTPDAPLIRAQIQYRCSATKERRTIGVIMLPDVAHVVQQHIDDGDERVKFTGIDGGIMYVTLADTESIQFWRI